MGTTNFDIVTASALAVSGTNIIAVTAAGAAPAFVNTDAPNTSARINALVSELTNLGLLA